MRDIKDIAISPREQQVLDLVVTGASNLEIGAVLGIAERTVKGYIGRMALRADIDAPRNKRVYLLNLLMAGEHFPLPYLSPHLARVAHLAMTGMTNSEIGVQVGAGENTIKNYMREIYNATGVWNRAELTGRYQ